MSRGSIFDGIKVADFTWAAAGPIITKQLADNGATVIKIESTRHPDSVRLGGPFKDGVRGINRSGFFADFNSSKLGIAIDMNHARAAEVVLPLVKWADVVADSFRPRVMDKWGFGYRRLSEVNPSVIMVSSSLYGDTGPWSTHPGFGAQGQAIAGFHGLTGWPDRPPAVPKGAYTDSVSPRFGMTALAAALIHRERTGQGQHIELAQVDTGVMFLSAEIVKLQAGGGETVRAGNADPRALLHAVLPCQGEDRWIAVEVWTHEQWHACMDMLASRGKPSAVLADPAAARHAPEAVERAVGELTAHWDAFELMGALRRAGVPAGACLRGGDLLADPVLRERGHFWPLAHPEMGTLDYNGPAYRFEHTPSHLTRAAPCLGADTDDVLGQVLGFASAKIGELRDCGVLA
ncbi:CaiB/BaiF CoA transferase family protein [Pigmentiphaga kullae]|uniref:Benzylsuccinate CoA-transferase BbsF subunit n=1 Tax=Pigmentiphaga kullae TaxID=151784 RepID=A0A4Q7NHP2_9BURK|nr:CoA transferase [Pigmentiphaga kullae]RZS84386.1 benzylsuccinate CoA-transferase BbsF subunit [Pigmentiphaga kullae]